MTLTGKFARGRRLPLDAHFITLDHVRTVAGLPTSWSRRGDEPVVVRPAGLLTPSANRRLAHLSVLLVHKPHEELGTFLHRLPTRGPRRWDDRAEAVEVAWRQPFRLERHLRMPS